MARNLILEYVISLHHATRIMKRLKQKRNAGFGFSYDLIDLGVSIRKMQSVPEIVPHYAWYKTSAQSSVDAYHIRIYKDVPGT
jgi:hypothetical protein